MVFKFNAKHTSVTTAMIKDVKIPILLYWTADKILFCPTSKDTIIVKAVEILIGKA